MFLFYHNIKRLLVLAYSTASSAPWIMWSSVFLWCFAASFPIIPNAQLLIMTLPRHLPVSPHPDFSGYFGETAFGTCHQVIRWAVYRPILFTSFSHRMWISLGWYPQLIISSMMSLQPAISWTAGFCPSLSVTLSQCVYALMKVCYGGLCFNALLLSSPYCLGRHSIWAFHYPLYLRC